MAGFVKPIFARENSCQSCVDLPTLVADSGSVDKDTKYVCDAILWARWPKSKMRLWYDIAQPAASLVMGHTRYDYLSYASFVAYLLEWPSLYADLEKYMIIPLLYL